MDTHHPFRPTSPAAPAAAFLAILARSPAVSFLPTGLALEAAEPAQRLRRRIVLLCHAHFIAQLRATGKPQLTK